MSRLFDSIDARTTLAGRNQLEVLLFSLGSTSASGNLETFAVNVFKVREIVREPEITRAPDMPPAVEGMTTLRDEFMPVINLPRYCQITPPSEPKIVVVTEYNTSTQGFLVHSVDAIVRLDWSDVKVPPSMVSGNHAGLITGVTKLGDGRLVMILDVEKVFADVTQIYEDDNLYENIQPVQGPRARRVLFADDSSVARKQISRTLEQLGIQYIAAKNGREAWELLDAMASAADTGGPSVQERLDLVLTDIEMPEMDGYVLTQRIKRDSRLHHLPVIMHSSLTGDANQVLGRGVGADAYVAKFHPRDLAQTMHSFLDMPDGAQPEIA